jgi:thymidine phosphorylase
MLRASEIGLSEAAWSRLGVAECAPVTVHHPPPLESLARVRRRIYGQRLGDEDFAAIIGDVIAARYADAHLASFITACSAFPLDVAEMGSLTRAMVEAGERLIWPNPTVLDKHCVGGLPGNRTTPIVVAICAALGVIIPKTSSRAITSPAGTADAMETLAPVNLDLPTMRKVVEQEGGCVVWGGNMSLSPADEILARMGRELDMDAEGQLVASILSKKIAAGATHAVIDVPVGSTAKIRTAAAAHGLIDRLTRVGRMFDLEIQCLITDGLQPVGRGIGPALEARDVLAVLKGARTAPVDLKDRALAVAGAVLELDGKAVAGAGESAARAVLEDGRAWRKFQRICEGQGGQRTPPKAPLRRDWPAPSSGRLVHINNRKLAKVAKLAGAPNARAAGLEILVKLGDDIVARQPLATIHAQAPGELEYALDYVAANDDIFGIEA